MRFIIVLVGFIFIFSCKTEPVDCLGISGGNAAEDNCDTCDADPANDCVDCTSHFAFNISMSSAYYYFQSVTINGVPLDTTDWVGAFNGDVCVGARKWDTTGYCSDGSSTTEEICESMGTCSDGSSATQAACTDALGEWTFSTWTWECGGGACDAPAMGYIGTNDTEGYCIDSDIPVFKIYDVSEGLIYHTKATGDIAPWQNFGFFVIDSLVATTAAPCQ